MLADLIRQGFGEEKIDLNWAEKILYGANKTYNLNLTKNALKMSAGFGGGMGIEKTCGALISGVMVLSIMNVNDRAHESDRIKELTREFLESYRDKMGGIDCDFLKENYRTEKEKCFHVILKAAEILDTMVTREKPEWYFVGRAQDYNMFLDRSRDKITFQAFSETLKI